jgi:large subunit ribosomal protein L4
MSIGLLGTHKLGTHKSEIILAQRSAKRYSFEGEYLNDVDLDPQVFGRTPNVALMHQVVTAYLASLRAGTQSTKTRSEVRGGGAKPFRQKGTGRARQGTTRAPQFTKGGVALGPKPRSYEQNTPKKMVRGSLYSALSDRARLNRIAVISSFDFDAPSTRTAVNLLEKIKVRKNILIALTDLNSLAEKSFRNLPLVEPILVKQLTTYSVLNSDWLIFDDESLSFISSTGLKQDIEVENNEGSDS